MGKNAQHWRTAIVVVGSFAAGLASAFLFVATGGSGHHTSSSPKEKKWGEFVPTPQVERINIRDGSLRLLADFVYIDPRKKPWIAQKDAVVDYASIPGGCRGFIGGSPLQGSKDA